MTSVHAYQLDFSSLSRTSATFGSARRDILTTRSEGENATPRMSARTSARSVLSEGHTPRPPTELPDPTRKHTFRASLNTSGRKPLQPANPCPVHSYADPPSSLQTRHGVAFNRMPTGRGLPPLSQAPKTPMLGPDFDAATRPGTVSATFSGVPRQLGARVVSTPVHAYATPSPMGKKSFKATFGTETRFDGTPAVSRPAHAHYTPSPMGKKAFKATFGTAARFGSGSCVSAAADVRPLPPRPQSRAPPSAVPSDAAAPAVAELPEEAAPPRTLTPPTRPLMEVVVPAAVGCEEKDLEKELDSFVPLSARLSAQLSARRADPSPWRHALPLPEIMPAPAAVAGAA